MNITLYHNSTPLNYMSRGLSGAAPYTGYLRDDCSILDPDIDISYVTALNTYNYAYIPDFGRYYYFRKPPTIRGKVCTLHLHADALYNYRAIIQASQCIAERSISHYNMFLPDSAILEEEGYIYHSGVLPYTFKPNNGSYVLTVAGGN